MVGSVEVEDFSKDFDEEICLIDCMQSTIRSSIWHIESGESSHINRQKIFFREL